MKIVDSIKNSKVYRKMTYDYTMEDFVSREKFERMQESKVYKFVSDWAGLATNKVVLGVYMDMKSGLLPGTSAIARGISLGFHSLFSPGYTTVRDFVYKKGKITSDKPRIVKEAGELLAFNIYQTPTYVVQIALAMGIRAALDSSVDFEPDKIANGAWEFFKNSWWLAPAGKWSMDRCRIFFGAKIPEQLADGQKDVSLEERV